MIRKINYPSFGVIEFQVVHIVYIGMRTVTTSKNVCRSFLKGYDAGNYLRTLGTDVV